MRPLKGLRPDVSFQGSSKATIIWVIWFLLPFVPLLVNAVLGWFRPSAGLSMVMQESSLQFKAMATFAIAWFLVGLAPSIMVRAQSFGKLLLIDLFWCALAGWYWGPTILAARAAPPAGAVGEPSTFEVAQSYKQGVDIRPKTGPAAGVRFSWDAKEWGDAITRSGKSVPGKVYKGKRGLWFATLD
jgi:hypothetical protein